MRKKIVQSSSCVSAPSGSIDIARTLGHGRLSAQGGLKRGTYPSSIPSGCGNWYLSWAPSNMWNSASRTKEQWFPWPAMIMEEELRSTASSVFVPLDTPSCDPYQVEGFPLSNRYLYSFTICSTPYHHLTSNAANTSVCCFAQAMELIEVRLFPALLATALHISPKLTAANIAYVCLGGFVVAVRIHRFSPSQYLLCFNSSPCSPSWREKRYTYPRQNNSGLTLSRVDRYSSTKSSWEQRLESLWGHTSAMYSIHGHRESTQMISPSRL